MQFNNNWNICKVSTYRYCLSYTPDGGKVSDFAIWHDYHPSDKTHKINQRLVIESVYYTGEDIERMYTESMPLAQQVMQHLKEYPESIVEFYDLYTEKRRNKE